MQVAETVQCLSLWVRQSPGGGHETPLPAEPCLASHGHWAWWLPAQGCKELLERLKVLGTHSTPCLPYMSSVSSLAQGGRTIQGWSSSTGLTEKWSDSCGWMVRCHCRPLDLHEELTWPIWLCRDFWQWGKNDLVSKKASEGPFRSKYYCITWLPMSTGSAG